MLSVKLLGCSTTTKTAGLKIHILAESWTRTWILYFPQLPFSSAIYLSILTLLSARFIFLIPPALPHCHFPPWHSDLLHSLISYTLLCIQYILGCQWKLWVPSLDLTGCEKPRKSFGSWLCEKKCTETAPGWIRIIAISGGTPAS